MVNQSLRDAAGAQIGLRTAIPQVLATSAKNILLLGYGMTLGFPTIVIPYFMAKLQNNINGTVSNAAVTNESLHLNSSSLINEEFSLTLEQISWIGSINLICVPLGCLASGPITTPLGRKRAMMLVNLPFVAAWLMFRYATSPGMLYTALVFTGIGGGLLEAPVLTYVAEITQPHLRGFLSATSSMCVILGVTSQLLGRFWVEDWRVMALYNLTLPVIALIALTMVPESPYWLMSKGRTSDAERSLQWLRGWTNPQDVQAELKHIASSVERAKREHAVPWRAYIKGSFLKPYALVAISFLIGHFSGMTTLQTFAVNIFASLGSPIDKYLATLYLGLVELAGSLVCMVAIHWTGKRPLTMVSTIGNGVLFIGVASYATWWSTKDALSWFPLAGLLLAALLSHIGIRLLPWILIGEVYPAQVRGVASGASGSIGYLFGFAANKTYLQSVTALTLPGTLFLYGGVSLAGAIILYFILPETEGKTLDEVQEKFASKKKNVDEELDGKARWAAENPIAVESHL